MTIEELDELIVKLKASLHGMGDVELVYAGNLLHAVSEYRDAAILARGGV